MASFNFFKIVTLSNDGKDSICMKGLQCQKDDGDQQKHYWNYQVESPVKFTGTKKVMRAGKLSGTIKYRKCMQGSRQKVDGWFVVLERMMGDASEQLQARELCLEPCLELCLEPCLELRQSCRPAWRPAWRQSLRPAWRQSLKRRVAESLRALPVQMIWGVDQPPFVCLG